MLLERRSLIFFFPPLVIPNRSFATLASHLHLPLTMGQETSLGTEMQDLKGKRPVIIGLYGLPGSGKSFCLNQLEQRIGGSSFEFFEGSQVIADVCPGGLGAFQKLEEATKSSWRRRAIEYIQDKCRKTGKTGVVAGHFMLWSEGEPDGQVIWTQADSAIYTHILYLDVPAEQIVENISSDSRKCRPYSSTPHLCNWQQAEKRELRSLCPNERILFGVLGSNRTSVDAISLLLEDFREHTEEFNALLVAAEIDRIVSARPSLPKAVLVMDADRTLAAEDSGWLFWKRASGLRDPTDKAYPLKPLFCGPLGYSYLAFRQAMLLYEEIGEHYYQTCEEVALDISMHVELVCLLHLLKRQPHVCAVVVTCGQRQPWQTVLRREGLADTVKVIGGGRLNDGYVVTPATKSAVVKRLRGEHGASVWAFGDSPLDLEMLREADRGIVVVGDEKTRSKTMDVGLQHAMKRDGFQLCQTRLPPTASHRLNLTQLPEIDITSLDFVDELVGKAISNPMNVIDTTSKPSAKLLMTPMRDKRLLGPALRDAHQQAGRYLAMGPLADLVGVEKFPLPHVQGTSTDGYRLFHERETLIVALMRGGEPMALGISGVFPLAMFLHAKSPEDITREHLEGRFTVLLVDSVVNSGSTVTRFIEHIREMHATVHIVVVAGVVYDQTVADGSSLMQKTEEFHRVSMVALRLSSNCYTGKGGTDTGNRLFSTVHLP